ncbi:PEP-CTERM sorting domain-containing protein [Ferribacterium limneticum]|nr:PEP-CTERM sorting domain-containing protein [Ferribacterium limneticum]
MSFENVFITDLDFSASNDSFVNLAGSFAYDKVTLDYWSQDKTGKFVKTSTASYDLRDGTGSVPAVATLFAQGVAGPQATVVPEPESYAMFLAGLGLLGAVARRRRIRA